jgi:hypothetical protein
MDRLMFGIRARSADRIVLELHHLALGDRVPDSPDAAVSYFTVAEVTENHAIVLFSRTHPLSIYRDVGFSWAFVLNDSGADAAAFGIGDIVQAGAMLDGIKARAELQRPDGRHILNP